MRRRYPNLFKARYGELHGRDWLRDIHPEDLEVFIDIGLQATDHGRLGGEALVEQKGKDHMSNIGSRGALVVNVRNWWRKRTYEETQIEFNLDLPSMR